MRGGVVDVVDVVDVGEEKMGVEVITGEESEEGEEEVKEGSGFTFRPPKGWVVRRDLASDWP